MAVSLVKSSSFSGSALFLCFYHGLRRGLLLVVKLMLLFFFLLSIVKNRSYLSSPALAVSIFIKFSLFESLAHALSVMSHQWLNDSQVVTMGSQNDSFTNIFASSGQICLQQSLSESSFRLLRLSIVFRSWFYALSRLFFWFVTCLPRVVHGWSDEATITPFCDVTALASGHFGVDPPSTNEQGKKPSIFC